jgi:hypothetical protein
MFRYIRYLDRLYILATDLGESHHTIEAPWNHDKPSARLYGASDSEESRIVVAWRFYNGKYEISAAHVASMVNGGALVDVLYSVVTNTWGQTLARWTFRRKARCSGDATVWAFIDCGDVKEATEHRLTIDTLGLKCEMENRKKERKKALI